MLVSGDLSLSLCSWLRREGNERVFIISQSKYQLQYLPAYSNCSDVLFVHIVQSYCVCAKIQPTSVVYTLDTRSRAPRLFEEKWRFFQHNVLNSVQTLIHWLMDEFTGNEILPTHYTVCAWKSVIQSPLCWKCQLLMNNRSDNQKEMAGEREREREREAELRLQ